MKLVEPIPKSVCKFMKLSYHFCEFVLPKEYNHEQSYSKLSEIINPAPLLQT